jgi:hypothetical protein
MEQSGLHKIKEVKQKYILYNILADAVLAAALALAGYILLFVFLKLPIFIVFVLFIIIFGILTAFRRSWLVNDAEVAGFLDASYPELEESSSIVLMPSTSLNFLQQLQLAKINSALNNIPSGHKYFTRRLRLSAFLLVAVLALAFIVNKVNYRWGISGLSTGEKGIFPENTVKETILPQVESVAVVVKPPAYTHLAEHRQSKFTLTVAEGALVSWNIKTTAPVKKMSLLFNDQEILTLKGDAEHTQWSADKVIIKSGFYQAVIDGKRSDLYQVEVIKDLPPVIQIETPKQYTYIDVGEKPQVLLNATVTDDYGISDATIFATIAKGSGEAVKFKEQKIPFDVSFSGNERKYGLKKMIDLKALTMEPGDELYFYMQARDNHAQLGRTEVYIVSIQDTAQLLSMDGILGSGNIKPEYFRSERQIILDDEQLLKEKDTLSVDKFKERSNDLGTDQKLLRLRYGKFLGEEAEGNIGDPRLEENNQHTDPKDFGDGAKIIDAYTDKHDNAEDAQFFDPTVKAQLKATLTEMWKAELQLRLYQPREALPFAYKALRLLKDLQQKSRSYVAKTSYNPTPLKMEKRLSGDLGKIIQPVDHLDIKQASDRFSALKRAAGILAQFASISKLNNADRQVLQQANVTLSEKAAQQPGIYLEAASAMRRLLNGNKKDVVTDISTVEAAIRNILPDSPKLPRNTSSTADMGLSKDYFLNLNHLNR